MMTALYIFYTMPGKTLADIFPSAVAPFPMLLCLPAQHRYY